MIGWATLAIYYSNLSGGSPRTITAILFLVAVIASIIWIRPKKYRLAAIAVFIVAVLIWFFSISASNDRDWLPDVAKVPQIEVNQDQLTVHNVRNFEYRSETDFTPRWEDRTYRLSDLRSVDLMLVYWGSKSIAHGMVSFGFADGQYLCTSIETRKERSEEYSAIQGFFRQYELIYIFADERDLVRLRTNFRNEDVYLYRTNVPPDKARALLISYVDQANDLARTPQFYNALTSNCVTNIVHNAQVVNPKARISWEILLSGYAARVAYRNGRLDTSMPFEELEARSHINHVARAAPDGPDFSRIIRAGLPVPGTAEEKTIRGPQRPNRINGRAPLSTRICHALSPVAPDLCTHLKPGEQISGYSGELSRRLIPYGSAAGGSIYRPDASTLR